jgi:hypothetical protein
LLLLSCANLDFDRVGVFNGGSFDTIWHDIDGTLELAGPPSSASPFSDKSCPWDYPREHAHKVRSQPVCMPADTLAAEVGIN